MVATMNNDWGKWQRYCSNEIRSVINGYKEVSNKRAECVSENQREPMYKKQTEIQCRGRNIITENGG